MSAIQPLAESVYEASWEVCNKVGGISTVIKSKVPLMVDYYKDYTLIGPYFEEKANVELELEDPPEHLREVFEEMAGQGINCIYGRWMIQGDPKVILIDSKALLARKDEIKTNLWERFQIDSIRAQWDFEEPMVWSWAVGLLLDAISRRQQGRKIVLHCHEWLAGFALLYLKSIKSPIATVFTTHATMLGRSIAGNGYDLYSMIDSCNPSEWAYKLMVEAKFTAERAMAHEADIFTTVSEITAMEANALLGKKPEVLLYNGLQLQKFPTIEETSIKHVTNREQIREFLSYYFFPYYTFNLDRTLTYFFVGRYEFHNKGLDILIDALSRLNARLQKEGSDRTVAVFFWVPMGARGVKQEIVENKNFYFHISRLVEQHSNRILRKLVYDLLAQKKDAVESVFTKEFIAEMRRDMSHFKRIGNPPILTHTIDNEHEDQTVKALLSRGLDNKPDDRVKVIVYPAYLDGSDSLLNLSYYEAISGCHLGCFPSSYEPWGYTPLETAACGVASITTDLAGFGRFMMRKAPSDRRGVYVLKRCKRSYEDAVTDLCDYLDHYAHLDHAERVEEKIIAKNLAVLADWKHFVKHYIEAHNRALGGK